MKSRLSSLALIALSALALPFVPSLASADEPAPPPPLVTWAQRRVDEGLLKPLAESEKERSKFSRARPVPHDRRARITQTTASADKDKRTFVPFAIDVKYGSGEWQNDIVGCVYTATGDLFVKRGDAYRPAAILLGKPADPVPGVCEAAAPPRA